MGCLNAIATQKPTGITVSATYKQVTTAAIVTQKPADIAINATYKQVTITASAVQICDVFISFPLYVADGRLYAADAALYVDKY